MNINIDQIMKDPKVLFDEMMRTNPDFVRFVNANKGKSAEQIAKDNNLDLSMLGKLMNKK